MQVVTKSEYYLLVDKTTLLRLRQQLSPSDPIMEQVNNNLALMQKDPGETEWPFPQKEGE